LEELEAAQRYIIGGMTYEGTASFEGIFKLSSGNSVIVQDDIWRHIVGEKLPDGSSRYIEGYGQCRG